MPLLARALDHLAMLPRSVVGNHGEAFALPTLAASDFAGPTPGRIDWRAIEARSGNALDRTFELTSPLPSGHPINDCVQLHLWRSQHQDPALAVLIPPWRARHTWPLHATRRELHRCGCDVLFLATPYHLRRTLPGSAPGDAFVSHDLDVVARAHRQAVREIWQVLLSVRELGHRRVGLLGLSLGGQLAAQAITRVGGIDMVGLVAPPDCPMALFRGSPIGHRHAQRLARQGVPRDAIDRGLTRLSELISPSRRQPLIDHGKIMIAVGRHDQIVPPMLSEDLARLWQCRVTCYDQGHIGLVFLETQFVRAFARALVSS